MEITSTEPNTQNAAPDNTLIVTEGIKSNLLETACWGKILAVIGFVGSGIMALGCVIMIFGAIFMSDSMLGMGIYGSTGLMGLAIVYLVLAAVGFLMCLYLYRFAKYVKESLADDNQMLLENAMMYQRKLYKFYGIVTIASIVLVIIFYIVLLGTYLV